MKPFKQLLIELNACEGAQEWAAEKSIEEAVSTCQRGDWMLWLAKKVNVGVRPLTHAKGKCANTVRHLMKDERSINAVDAAIDFGNGVINEDELAAYAAADAAAADAAYAYAYAADADAAAAYAAADAAYAAAYAASAASAADAASAYAAADAAYAAAYAASAASAASASAASASAASAAASAADAAYAYAASAAASSRKENQLLTADICREIIGAEIVIKVNELLNQ